jgi:hypothetical protein
MGKLIPGKPLMLIILIQLLSGGLTIAQEDNPGYCKFSAELNAGTLTPFGDVKQNPYWPAAEEFSLGGGLRLNYHISPIFTLQGSFMAGNLSGFSDSKGLEFKSSLRELSLKGKINFTQAFSPGNPLNSKVQLLWHCGYWCTGIWNRPH